MTTPTQRPETNEYAPFYAGYVSLVPETDILKVLRDQAVEYKDFVSSIGPEKAVFRYAPEKWSISELLGHIADAERVFSFRAMTFARGDSNALPGFDENEYVRQANFDQASLDDLMLEFLALREGNVRMLARLNEDAWMRSGISNNNSITVRALAYIMAGHVRHHLNVMKERYL